MFLSDPQAIRPTALGGSTEQRLKEETKKK
jgi:hypothetical protein